MGWLTRGGPVRTVPPPLQLQLLQLFILLECFYLFFPLLPAHMYTGNSTWAIAAAPPRFSPPVHINLACPSVLVSPSAHKGIMGTLLAPLPAHQQQASGTTSLSPQPGLVLSPTAAPFPKKLVDKIQAGSFVEMKELLTDNMSLISQLETVACRLPTCLDHSGQLRRNSLINY